MTTKMCPACGRDMDAGEPHTADCERGIEQDALFAVPCTECKKPIPEEDVVWAGGTGEEFPWHVACCPPQYAEEDDDVR